MEKLRKKIFKLAVFVPENSLETVKQALFTAGAGKIGDYDQCSWQTKGLGQFRGSKNSRPAIGRAGMVEKVEEYKLEMVVASEFLTPSLLAIKASHPYETPAYEVFEMFSELDS
jgi:hypothetical protein